MLIEGFCSGNFVVLTLCSSVFIIQQESRAFARKLRDVAAVLFGLKFADTIHYNF